MANHIKIKNPFIITVRLPADLVGDLDSLALDDQMSRNDKIIKACIEFVNKKSKKK